MYIYIYTQNFIHIYWKYNFKRFNNRRMFQRSLSSRSPFRRQFRSHINYQLGHYKCTAPRKHSRANHKVGRTESPGQLNARCLYTTRFPRDMNNLSATDIGIIASKIDTGWETAFTDYLTRLVSRLLIFLHGSDLTGIRNKFRSEIESH